MKFGISLSFIILTQLSLGQNRVLTDEDYCKSSASKITFVNKETCEEIDLWIKSDFKNKTIFLFLSGGVAQVEYTTDKDFENYFGIHFYDFGCIAPSYNCVVEYNSKVFDYLTRKFGKKWMKSVRKDVIGLKEWKRNYRRKKKD